jgi:hypothetical protein
MVIMFLNPGRCSLSFNRLITALFIVSFLSYGNAGAQCLSSVNPVGGSANLLVLEKNSIRVIGFYRFNYGDRYFEGSSRSDFDLIRNANYNYAGTILGYGVAHKVTLETELGYFINKTQNYNTDPQYSLKGTGFSTGVLSVKYSLFKDDDKRLFVSPGLGVKIPFSTKPLYRDGVELPVEVQPTLGAFGLVIQGFIVKEQPITGIRYFLTGRMEVNSRNRQEYRLGTSVFTSFFISKHLMFPWLKGDWTAIFQLRNEIRGVDRTMAGVKESSGSTIIYLVPQINFFIKEKWNVSLMTDLPVYQHFNGIQLATRYGITLNFAREFRLKEQ